MCHVLLYLVSCLMVMVYFSTGILLSLDTTYILNEIIHTYLLEHGSTKPSLTQEYQETACDSDYNSPKKETNNYQPLTIKYNEAYNNQHHVHIVVGTHDVNVRQRLCRRWLDNMCLIVYEDLCCYVLHTGGMPGIETDAARVTEVHCTIIYDITSENLSSALSLIFYFRLFSS